MLCPLCRVRRSRRTCPALGRDICPVCCGTKRLVDIACPESCGYLRVAQVHPPAVLARQRERDARFIMPMVHRLSERAYALLLLLHQVVLRHRGGAIPALNDRDVAEAAGALASTLETTERGILYDHRPASLPAQRLLSDLRGALDEVAKAAGPAARVERDAVVALRRMEKAARDAHRALQGADTAYLDLLARLPRGSRDSDVRVGTGGPAEGPDPDGDGPARVIIP